MRQKMLSEALRERFGTKVYKLSLTSGCTCPNRDGTIGTGGCTFCSEGGSGEFAAPFLPIDEQIRVAKQRVDSKFPAKIPVSERRYIAYFQSFTNTWGDVDRLRRLYLETIRRPKIAVLSIGTRPDCLPAEILQMLQELRAIKPVWVELGLQTMHEQTAQAVNRGYSLPVFEEACRNLHSIGVEVIVHLILGLPGESREDMLETVRYISRLDPLPEGIKLQQLQVLRGTEIGKLYEKLYEKLYGKSCEKLHEKFYRHPNLSEEAHSDIRREEQPFPIMSLEEYCSLVRDCLEILPESIVVHRLTGDGPKSLLIEPSWSADKKRVLNTMRKYLT